MELWYHESAIRSDRPGDYYLFQGGGMSKNAQPRRWIPFLMMAVGAALVLGVGGWYLGSILRDTDTASVEVPQAEENYPQIQRVSLTDAKAAYDNGSAVFVDVRDADTYAQQHIPGALSIPLAELADRTGELNPGDWIITY